MLHTWSRWKVRRNVFKLDHQDLHNSETFKFKNYWNEKENMKCLWNVVSTSLVNVCCLVAPAGARDGSDPLVDSTGQPLPGPGLASDVHSAGPSLHRLPTTTRRPGPCQARGLLHSPCWDDSPWIDWMPLPIASFSLDILGVLCQNLQICSVREKLYGCMGNSFMLITRSN